ncbi:MAG: hypothetical protein D6694_11165, partial [Gammaproteobacteria bacterium]
MGNNVSVTLAKQVRISLDSLTPYDVVPVVPWVTEQETYLFLTNPWNRSVDVYGVEQARLVNRLQPVKGEGNEGEPWLHTPRTCVVISPDSILVFERGSITDAVLIDWRGDIVDEAPMKYFASHAPSFFNHGGRVLLHENVLYFKNASLDIDLSDLNAARHIPLCYKYDLNRHEFSALPLYYPPSYLKRGAINYIAGVPQLDVVTSRDMMVVNWAAKSRLEFRRLSDFSLVEERLAHISRWGKTLLHAPVRGKNQYGGYRKENEELFAFVSYVTVFYDRWRDLIYRLAFLPSKQLPPPDVLDDMMAPGQNRLGVVVLDSKGQLKGYAVFPAKTYWPYTSFVGKEGLYLSKANVYRDDFSEDYLEYDVFVFEPA